MKIQFALSESSIVSILYCLRKYKYISLNPSSPFSFSPQQLPSKHRSNSILRVPTTISQITSNIHTSNMNQQRKIYFTRQHVRTNHPTGRHPWLGIALPTTSHRRGPTQEGHPNPSLGPSTDTSDVPTFPYLGAPLYPKGDVTTHVRSKRGGYVNFWTHSQHKSHAAYLKSKKAKTRRAKMGGSRVGSERRRWVWRHGKPAGRGGKGKKVVGVERRRDTRGQFV